MDKNTITGFILIAIILIGYNLWMQPSQEEIERGKLEAARRKDSIEMVEQSRLAQEQKKNQQLTVAGLDSAAVVSDSLRNVDYADKFGPFAACAEGKIEHYILENNKIKVDVNTKGGRVYSVVLKEYSRWDSTQVKLFDGDDNKFGFKFFAHNRSLNTQDFFFSTNATSKNIVVTDEKSQSLSMKLKVSEGKYIEYLYTLANDSYELKFDVNFVGMDDIIGSTNSTIDLEWTSDIPGQEKGHTWENENTTIYYRFLGDEVDYLSERSDEESEDITTKLQWVAFKQHFFSSVLIAGDHIAGATLNYTKIDTSAAYLKHFEASMSLPYAGKASETIPLSFYYGPNKYKMLKVMGKERDLKLNEIVPLGWGIFGWVNRLAIIPMFNFMGTFINNYGLIILLMTIVIKLILFPLTYKSYVSTAKMRVLKPQIDEINAKIPADKTMERQQATMALYKKAGVNPLGGCLPMLLQMPILIAMYRFFPASIELRQKSFLWATDLSTYDSIFTLPFEIPFYGDHVSLFCLLMAGSMYLTTAMNSGQMDSSNPQMASMRIMMYFMPIMMLFWFNSYSSGLSYYYFVANIITYVQMVVIRRTINDEEILTKLQAATQKKKATTVTKSKFQLKLEEMAKQRGQKPPTTPRKK